MEGVLGGLIFVGVVGSLFLLARHHHKQRTYRLAVSQVFADRLEEYIQIPTQQYRARNPSIRGKILPITTTNGLEPSAGIQINWSIYFELPQELRATKPDDTNTIILIEYGYRKQETYLHRSSITKNNKAFIYTAQITIIDLSMQVVLGEKQFDGWPPLASSSPMDGKFGPKPDIEIAKYLRELPRR